VKAVWRRHEHQIDLVPPRHEPLGKNEHASLRAAAGQAAQHQADMGHFQVRPPPVTRGRLYSRRPAAPHLFVSDIELGKLFDPDYRLDARACAEAWAKG